MLNITELESGYGDLQILRKISLTVEKGEIVALLGPNGAGKTTTLKTIMGILPDISGEIVFDGKNINDFSTHNISKMGLSYIPEDRRLFPGMTVIDNLLMGGYSLTKEETKDNLAKVFDLFPRLEERKKQYAGTMSGGERQMLAIGRGLMLDPKMIIVDEPSLGLAPNLVEDTFAVFSDLQKEGVTILVVEQNVNLTLEHSDRAYILEQGEINMEGKSEDLKENEYVQNVYLGAEN